MSREITVTINSDDALLFVGVLTFAITTAQANLEHEDYAPDEIAETVKNIETLKRFVDKLLSR